MYKKQSLIFFHDERCTFVHTTNGSKLCSISAVLYFTEYGIVLNDFYCVRLLKPSHTIIKIILCVML